MKNQAGFVDVLFVLFMFALAGLATAAEAVNYKAPISIDTIDPKCFDGTMEYPKDIRQDPCIMGDQAK
ncbi:MAG: hypothetical protein AABY22_12420 [Nanoarchaeota archaeon]